MIDHFIDFRLWERLQI